jgi:hypothetical protein
MGGLFDVVSDTVGGTVLVRDSAISAPINIVDNTIGGSLVCRATRQRPPILANL